MLPGFFVALKWAVPFCFARNIVCLVFLFYLFFTS